MCWWKRLIIVYKQLYKITMLYWLINDWFKLFLRLITFSGILLIVSDLKFN